MKNEYSKKQLEELYNCTIFRDTGFDSGLKFWVAQGLPFTESGEDKLFTHADGWDLDELHENIRTEIREIMGFTYASTCNHIKMYHLRITLLGFFNSETMRKSL